MDQYGTYGAESILECNMKIVTRAIAHLSSGSQLRFLAHTPTRTRAITHTAPRVHGVQEHVHGSVTQAKRALPHCVCDVGAESTAPDR